MSRSRRYKFRVPLFFQFTLMTITTLVSFVLVGAMFGGKLIPSFFEAAFIAFVILWCKEQDGSRT